jgi:RNA polymerase sigma-70 factor (ECF subfamily)
MSADTRRRATESAGPGHGGSVAALALSLEAPPVAVHEVPRFEVVYEQLFDFVWRSARRLGVSEGAVDDVVQEVFLVVHRRLAGFEGRSSLKTWVFAILLRVVSDWRRTQRRKGGHASLDAITTAHGELADERAPCPAGALEQAEAVRLLHRLLDELDDDKRTVFVLAELEQTAVPEIAEMLGIPLNTAYSRLRAARIEFEKALARHHAREAHRRAR